MTATELRAALAALGWSQGELARRYGINPRTVRGYLSDGDPIPPTLATFIAREMGCGGPRWLIADGIDGPGKYLVHLHRPRFVARIVDTNNICAANAGADTISGITMEVDRGILLCEIEWTDDPRCSIDEIASAAGAALRSVRRID